MDGKGQDDDIFSVSVPVSLQVPACAALTVNEGFHHLLLVGRQGKQLPVFRPDQAGESSSQLRAADAAVGKEGPVFVMAGENAGPVQGGCGSPIRIPRGIIRQNFHLIDGGQLFFG